MRRRPFLVLFLGLWFVLTVVTFVYQEMGGSFSFGSGVVFVPGLGFAVFLAGLITFLVWGGYSLPRKDGCVSGWVAFGRVARAGRLVCYGYAGWYAADYLVTSWDMELSTYGPFLLWLIWLLASVGFSVGLGILLGRVARWCDTRPTDREDFDITGGRTNPLAH